MKASKIAYKLVGGALALSAAQPPAPLFKQSILWAVYGKSG
ncbi:hypothetical protein [Streptomyces griseorubiginosus]